MFRTFLIFVMTIFVPTLASASEPAQDCAAPFYAAVDSAVGQEPILQKYQDMLENTKVIAVCGDMKPAGMTVGNLVSVGVVNGEITVFLDGNVNTTDYERAGWTIAALKSIERDRYQYLAAAHRAERRADRSAEANISAVRDSEEMRIRRLARNTSIF